MRVAATVGKILVIGYILYQTAYYSFNDYRYGDVVYRKGVIAGTYDVNVFRVNHDTIPAGADSLRWQDVVFDETHTGSLITCDSCFRPRYGRHYFAYDFDTVKKTISIHKSLFDSVNRYVLTYSFPDTSQLVLTGMRGKDTLYVAMKKNNRKFDLQQKPFHWLSESPW
jgi:hypothetical protein